jgi:hypothetical protein
MKSLLSILFCILISNTLVAQGITKYGSNTASSTYFVSNNGKLGSTTGLDKYGKISVAPFICGNTLTINHKAANGVAPIDATINYGTVVSSLTGSTKCWITRNLGASSMASGGYDDTTEAAGWYWQFNRKKGYIGSATAIADYVSRISENITVWASGEDPCALELGSGWRIPDDIEWKNADANGQVGGWDNYDESWADVLKLHAAGYLDYTGMLFNKGRDGGYWTRRQHNTDIDYGWIFFSPGINYESKAYGFSVRCINDNILPTVSSTSVLNLTPITASFSATISSAGVPAVTTKFLIGDDDHPEPSLTSNINHITGSLSALTFTTTLTGLNPNKQYYVKAYATNANGTVYGAKVGFKTPAAVLPTFSTEAVVAYNYDECDMIYMNSSLSTDGTPVTTDYGFVVGEGTNTYPTYENALIVNSVNSAGGGSFNALLKNLSPNTTYYVRAYAKNAAGIVYQNSVATVTTKPIAIGNKIFGGYIGYIFSEGEAGYVNGEVHGLAVSVYTFGMMYRASADSFCRSLVMNNYGTTGWFLPTKDQLQKIQGSIITNVIQELPSPRRLWTSTQYSGYYYYYYLGGTFYTDLRGDQSQCYVCPMHYF